MLPSNPDRCCYLCTDRCCYLCQIHLGQEWGNLWQVFETARRTLFVSEGADYNKWSVWQVSKCKVQNVHPFTLFLTSLQAGQATRQFRLDMFALHAVDDSEVPLHKKFKKAQNDGLKIFKKNLSSGSILAMLTQKYLSFQSRQNGTLVVLRNATTRERYLALTSRPKPECESWEIRNILHTLESLLHWKCSQMVSIGVMTDVSDVLVLLFFNTLFA